MDEIKEKINSIFENLKKSQNFTFFLSDKKHQPLNLNEINLKINNNTYKNVDSFFLI